MQISAISCGDGNREAFSSLGRGTPKSKSLLHTYLLDIALGEGKCPGVVDNGYRGRLWGLTASETIVPDHDEGFALRLIQEPVARGHEVHPVKEAAFLLQSKSLLCTQEEGTESVDEMSGRAGVSRDGENSLEGKK